MHMCTSDMQLTTEVISLCILVSHKNSNLCDLSVRVAEPPVADV